MPPNTLPSKEEIGRRLRWVRKYAAGMNGRDFATAMGSADASLVSKLENGSMGFTLDRLVKISKTLAGQGMLKETTPEEVFWFLEGRSDELNVRLTDGSFSQMSYFVDSPDFGVGA